MKILRIALFAIMLTSIIGCVRDASYQQDPIKPVPDSVKPTIGQLGEWLETRPGVHSVQELKSPNYKKHYLIIFKQLLDPKNPAAGTFLQRVFLSHQDFDNPVVFETEGYNAQWYMTNTVQNELTKRYKANYIVVEHRYSGLSVPSSLDWKYVTSENGAADLHAVRVSLGTGYTGNWLATGVSKGGTNAMSYIMYYPTDMVATVAYVGPICNAMEDTRFLTHMQTVATPKMRNKILNFQRELLIRRNTIQPLFDAATELSFSSKENMTNDQLYECTVTEFSQAVWQEGWSIDEIPEADATDNQIIDYLTKNKVFDHAPLPMFREIDRSRTFIGNYLRKSNMRLTRTDVTPDLSNTHYYVQALIELGRYAKNVKPIEDLMPDHKSWSVNTMARFIVPAAASNIQFSNKLYLQMTQWLQSNDPRLICVYGEYDPWTAAAPDRNYFDGKDNMAIFIQQKGSHSAQIEDLDLADKHQAWTKLDKWLKK